MIRRVRDRRPGSLFRGAELPRLMTMIVMLGVIMLLVARARDASSWRWLTGDSPVRSAEPAALAAVEASVVAADPTVGGPTDEDPQEADAAREEFQVVTDKAPLSKEEMPAYWRLMAWQQHQTIAEMSKRANANVTFQQLWQQPEKWRGRLIEIPVLHLRQTAQVEDLADNALGLNRMYEVWGWNTESQPYSYWLVCPQLPPGMPSGQNIYAEASFVGYFLKLFPYEDHEGKTLATPLLIGRIVWHSMPDAVPAYGNEWIGPWLIAGGAAVLFAIRLGLRWTGFWPARSKSAMRRAGDPSAVEAWLDRDR